MMGRSGVGLRRLGTRLGRVGVRLVPALALIRDGRIALGALLLALPVALLAVALLRRDRLWPFLASGAPDERLAVLTLALGLALSWWVAERGRRRLGPGGGPVAGARSRDPFIQAFMEMRTGVAALVVIGLVYLAALLTPLLAPFDPAMQGDLVTGRLLPPSRDHLLGTDQFGRDQLSRLLYGARISLAIGLVAVGVAVTLGTLVGALAGYAGGWIDAVLMRLVDMVIAFPRLVLLIAIVALFQPSIVLIMVILGLTQWPHIARIVRGEVMSVREREFVVAGRVLGFGPTRVLVRHVLPNSLAPLVVAASLGVGDAIVVEAILSFLGLGVRPPTPSWGVMVAEGRAHMLGAWWLAAVPGMAIVAVVLAFNLAGDAFRDALDPRRRR